MNKTISKAENFTEFTTISSKGQIVIPKVMRASLGLKDGDLFAASLIDNKIIVLKNVSIALSEDEEEILNKVKKVWSEVDAGRARKMSKKKFLAELQRW